MNKQSQTTRRPVRWMLLILATAVIALLLGGCFGSQGSPQLSEAQTRKLGREMVAIEQMSATELTDYENTLEERIDTLQDAERTRQTPLQIAEANFLLGYAAEYRKTAFSTDGPEGVYRTARGAYEDATTGNTGYASQARYRLGVLGSAGLLGARDESLKIAKRELGMLKTATNVTVWVRQPAFAGEGGAATIAENARDATRPVLTERNAGDVAMKQLDVLYRTGGGFDTTKYQIVDAIVNAFNRITPAYGAVLALLLLAIIVKILTLPFTNMTFRGMRDMQRIQPLLKELQEKYKDDKAKQAEEQMRIMKEHKVNPAGGCLPMLIQFPIFIVVYQAVMVYAAEFANYHFLWIKNLALPDLPLLVLYAVSMFVTQKLTTTPTADPQQRMLQQQMAIMMPIFLFFVLTQFASAFVLYWFFLNVLSSAHQYYLMRKFAHEDAATGAAPAVAHPEVTKSTATTNTSGKRGKRR